MKMIIIRSTDNISWERYGKYEYPFIKFYDSEYLDKAIKDVLKMKDVEDYYVEFVELDYFNEFKRPFE